MPCKKIEEIYAKSKIKFITKKSKMLGILTVYLIILLLLIILINFILPVVFESVRDLINNIQNYYEIAINNYNNLPDDNILKSNVVNDAIRNIQNLDIKQYFQLEKILEYVMNAIDAVTRNIWCCSSCNSICIYFSRERPDTKNDKKIRGSYI